MSSRSPLARLVLVVVLALVAAPAAAAKVDSYRNPLPVQIPGDGLVETCADPDVIRANGFWYAYCTTDPLNDEDRNAAGGFNFHLIPILRSENLTDWTYVGDAFASRPGWVGDTAGMWAPEINFFNGQYYLYYGASDTDVGGSAIGVATAPTPTGPWTDSGRPVVEPHPERRWVFDPEIVTADGQRYIFYGSYFGGIFARQLSPDGLQSNPATQTPITIDNRYEGAHVIRRNGFWYLFVSATDCCRGPLTGYSVFVGRSQNVLGPYVDRSGASLLDARVGGTVVLSMNGNRWVGPGHITTLHDFGGQDWMVYHAIDRLDPYFEGAVGFTKRPMLMDPLDWVNGWPTVRGGLWASDRTMHGPAAQPGDRSRYKPKLARWDEPHRLLPEYSDEFGDAALDPQWAWVRQPAPATYRETAGVFSFDTQAADLHVDSNNASVLVEDAPNRDYVVETRMALTVPPEGCCFNYVQGGLVVYANDDNFVKLAHVSIWNTRQTEFAKELAPVPQGYPRYGNTVVGPPGDWTYLRIVKKTKGASETYRAYTSRDGRIWERGGVWTHSLGSDAKIGLVSMGGAGFTSAFDYVRVWTVKAGDDDR